MANVYVDVNSLDFELNKDKFSKQREQVSKYIREYILRLVDIKEFVNCETFFHSKRQELLEDIHLYMDLILLLQQRMSMRKSDVLNNIVGEASSNFNYKSKEEKLILIDGDTVVAKTQQFIDLYNNQIMFLNESKKTIEGVIYNMKYRFEIQKYINVC